MSTKENAMSRRSLLSRGAAVAGLGLLADLEAYPQNVNRNSIPSDLKITDMRIAVLRGPGGQSPAGRAGARGGRGPLPPATPGTGGASGGTIIVRIDTNQGISGYGQTIGDGPQPNYVLTHKARVLGENPCNVDKIFRKIKIHGAYNRRGSGVNAIENALWDLAGKAYGVPIYQMLGGKFRDKVRMYTEGNSRSDNIKDIAADYRERVAAGFTMLKMDLGVPRILQGKRGTMFAPAGYNGEPGEGPENYYQGLEISDKGCELVADYVASIKEAMGDAADIPMGHDHFGHLTAKSCIKLANALERVTPSYLEDMVPWFRVEEWKLITNSIRVPTLTGEDAYLVESLEPLCQARAVDYIHPDHLVIGGCLELKKTADMAAKYSVGMMVHSNATPIGYAAGAHAIAACQNFLAMEWHQPQPAWHKDITDAGDLWLRVSSPFRRGPAWASKSMKKRCAHSAGRASSSPILRRIGTRRPAETRRIRRKVRTSRRALHLHSG
ncbi:MAG: mandelate racemase/muconate lactonizing enzyme family protein [Bryobacterales bacterium]|nr:mandelate racemase/muconate lactonizing enzyme family protein [Bryobacterales bacterium]